MVNDKQYIISDISFDSDDFISVPLQNKKILSYHKNLQAQIIWKNDTAFCVILGYAFQSDSQCSSPISEMERVPEHTPIESIIESWAGRWLLIYDHWIYMDACGLLGCYYTSDGILSSSVNCINKYLHKRNKNAHIKHRFGLDYYPGPNTQYNYIKRLLPSQTYDFFNNCCGKRTMLSESIHYETDQERISAFIRHFSAIVNDLKQNYKGKIMVPLTGGYDSRTLIALLEYCDLDYTVFTMEHGNISEDDKNLPPLLTDKIHRPFQYIPRNGKPDRKRFKQYDEHCGYMALDEDRNFFAYHQYPENKEPTAILRANIWEIAWGHYYAKLRKYKYQLSCFNSNYVNIRGRKDMRTSLAEWLDYAKSNKQSLPFANRFYWEQRVGCWLSGIEQSLTVIENMDSLPLCNCTRLLSILLDFDIKERKGKQHQVQIIAHTCPELLDIPFAGKTKASSTHWQTIKKDCLYIFHCFTCLDMSSSFKEAFSYMRKKIKAKKLIRQKGK